MSIVIGDAYQQMRVRAWHVKDWLRSFVKGSPASRRGQLADLRVALRRPHTVVHVEGLRLAVDLRDNAMGRPLYIHGRYEPEEVNFLRRHLRPGMTFADIGANIGFFSNLAARLVGPAGTVAAFEPDPDNFRLLRRNRELNRTYHIHAHNVALGDAPGRARLFRSSNHSGDHHLYARGGEGRPSVEVAVETVDRVWRQGKVPPPDVAKMDVQGYEGHILRGMSEVLAEPRLKLFLIEVWPHGLSCAGSSTEAVFDAMERHGFAPNFLADSGELLPTTRANVFGVLDQFDPARPDLAWINVIFQRLS